MATLSITVPDELTPRVMTALRAQYPDLTAGKTDAQAARAVIAFWTRTALAAYESDQAIKEDIETRRQVARDRAWSDGSTIT